VTVTGTDPITVVGQVSAAGGDVCGLQSTMTVARLDMHNQALIPCIVDEQAPALLLLLLLLLIQLLRVADIGALL